MSATAAAAAAQAWPDALYDVLLRQHVRQVAYVPDAGHSRLIARCEADPNMVATVLTTEEEGVALLAGAWLGGDRGVLLMQSSGVGNCVNMFTLLENCRLPFVTLVTMRGEWGEFNPWQAAMGQASGDILTRMGVQVHRVEDPSDAAPTLEAAIRQSYDGMLASAVLLSQRLIGRKAFTEEG
jgi:sulfopyruvate decarboxylase TPP-binding subunit